jgi:ketosteroid isomerase-like protein
MTQEDLRMLREMYGRPTLAAAAELIHPDAEMHQPAALPDTDDYYGREELVRGTQRWLEEWEGHRFTLEEAIDLGERALLRVRLSGRAKASGVRLHQTVFHLWTFRDGMPWRCDVFLDEKTARGAGGRTG